MIQFSYHPSPNPAKVALFLEESGMEYRLMPVDTRNGEQHSPKYLVLRLTPMDKGVERVFSIVDARIRQAQETKELTQSANLVPAAMACLNFLA